MTLRLWHLLALMALATVVRYALDLPVSLWPVA